MPALLMFDGDSATEVTALERDGALVLDAAAVLAATGWELKPYGLCRGDVCNPARFGSEVTVGELAATLHRPVAVETEGEPAVAVLGETSGTAIAAGQVAPTVTLPDVDGNPVQVTGRG